MRRPPRVELVSIGSELLMGKVNAHVAYFSEKFEELGLPLSREVTVGDDPKEMASVFRETWKRADAVIATGGLGPTFDDITRSVWSRVTGRPLRFHRDIARSIEERFRRRGWRMPRINRRQAYVLEGARILENPNGTAPGQLLATPQKALFLLPGPARELHPMAEADVFPFLRERFRPGFRGTRAWRIFGFPESWVDQRLGPLMKRRGSIPVQWGILAQGFVISVKATALSADRSRLTARLDVLDRAMTRRFGRALFGGGQDTLEESVGSLLRARRKTLAVAESCTGGLLSQKITSVPGSSDYFLEGRVSYANAAKRRLLGVRASTLSRWGAVSGACAAEMARGCRRRSGADYALAVTGVAGPAGGTPEKPVGLVYLALASARRARVLERKFSGNREAVRELSALTALDLLRRELLEITSKAGARASSRRRG